MNGKLSLIEYPKIIPNAKKAVIGIIGNLMGFTLKLLKVTLLFF